MPKIFISYRRIDSLERTHRIADWLTLKYGERNVFIDVDRLGGGVDFEDVLQASLEQANVLLVIIGEKWLEELNNRIEDRQQGKDYVYLEVVQGLQKNIDLVIPVMINNTPFLQDSDLPIEMQELTRRQLARVRANPDFHKDMEVIRQIIDKQFWYERVIRYGLGAFSALLVLAIVIFGTIFFLSEPEISEADAVETAVARLRTETALPSATGTSDLTATISAILSTDAANEAIAAVAPTRNVNLTATFESILAQAEDDSTSIAVTNASLTEAALPTETDTPTRTPRPTVTDTPSPTPTENRRATVAAQSTSNAQMTVDAQALTDEQRTQVAQATDNAPTNTPNPTVTRTPLPTPTWTDTPSPTATYTPSPTATPTVDTTATEQALANLTETQVAFATQIFATAQASRVLLGRVDIVEDLNVRSEPSTEGSVIGVAGPGAVLPILEQTDDEAWIQIRLQDGRSGWVSSEFFRVLGLYAESEIDELRSLLRLVFTQSDWEPVTREIDGVPMVLVPAGCFTLGTSQSQAATLNTLSSAGMDVSDEQPIADICVTYPYWIDQFEVSQSQFAEFGGVAEAAPVFEGDNLPQDSVTWDEAFAYCAMRGGYLPSEVQWEYAARGVDDNLFPWGNRFELDIFNWNRTTDVDETEPVDWYPEGASWVGAYQMAGNVWEWTLSRHYAYPNPTRNQIFLVDFDDLDVQANRVLRGSSYRVGIDKDARSANRLQENPRAQRSDVGIRCVRNFEGELSDTGG